MFSLSTQTYSASSGPCLYRSELLLPHFQSAAASIINVRREGCCWQSSELNKKRVGIGQKQEKE
jgi:hypothetical protein